MATVFVSTIYLDMMLSAIVANAREVIAISELPDTEEAAAAVALADALIRSGVTVTGPVSDGDDRVIVVIPETVSWVSTVPITSLVSALSISSPDVNDELVILAANVPVEL